MDGPVSAGNHRQAKKGKKDFAQYSGERSGNYPLDGKALGHIEPFFTIDWHERREVVRSLRKPLSGYLGGKKSTGYWVNNLEDDWKTAFQVKHAIACNSATSGLLAACMAADIGPGDTVWCSDYTMSASAACAMVLGAMSLSPPSIGPSPMKPLRASFCVITGMLPTAACISVVRAALSSGVGSIKVR